MKHCVPLTVLSILSGLALAAAKTVSITLYYNDGFDDATLQRISKDAKKIISPPFKKTAPEFSYLPLDGDNTRHLEEGLLRNFERALQINQCNNLDCTKKANWNKCKKLGCACTCGGRRGLAEQQLTNIESGKAETLHDDIATKVREYCPDCLFDVIIEDVEDAQQPASSSP